MGLLFRLIAHLLVTLARLAGPGGVRASPVGSTKKIAGNGAGSLHTESQASVASTSDRFYPSAIVEESDIVEPRKGRIPMRKSRFTEEQISHALRQAETGTMVNVLPVIRKPALRHRFVPESAIRHTQEPSGQPDQNQTINVPQADPLSRLAAQHQQLLAKNQDLPSRAATSLECGTLGRVENVDGESEP